MLQIDLTGKCVLITGATGDLGRVMVRTLAACGARVAVHYLTNTVKAEELVYEVGRNGGEAAAFQWDVTDPGSVDQLRDAVTHLMGAPDIVITSAVIQYEPKQTVLDQPITDYDSQYRSCVLHNVAIAKAFVPAMIEKQWGRFIGINTECSMLYNQWHSAYVSGKRGMDGVLRVLTREVGPHQVTVNQVAPGFMISDRERAMNRTKIEGYDEQVPLQRRGNDQDVANMVAFLASDLASFITGAFIPVCGGHVMPAI